MRTMIALFLSSLLAGQEDGEFERRERKKAEAFQKKLEKDPDDAEANEAVGKFHCLVLGEWAKGLPFLEKGRDKELKALATKELAADPKDAPSRISVADAWWTQSARLKGTEAKAARSHAAALYRQGAAEAPKADRKRIVARVNQQFAEAGALVLKLPANVAWLDTGADLVVGETLKISATGKWCLDANLETGGVDQKGYQKLFDKKCPHPTAFVMCLIFKVGESGKLAAAYKDCPYNVASPGKLFIGCNDFGPGDNTGELTVTIERSMN